MIPRELSNCWKIDGVIQGSRTSQPPRLTPRTFSLAQEKGALLSARLSMMTLEMIVSFLRQAYVASHNVRCSLGYSSSVKRDDCVAELHF